MGIKPTVEVEQAPLSEMKQRAKESLSRNPRYNVIGSSAMMADGKNFFPCTKGTGPKDNFVLYVEVLPDGSPGQMAAEPMNDTAKCFEQAAAKSRYATPPGSYVLRVQMNFKPSAS